MNFTEQDIFMLKQMLAEANDLYKDALLRKVLQLAEQEKPKTFILRDKEGDQPVLALIKTTATQQKLQAICNDAGDMEDIFSNLPADAEVENSCGLELWF